MTRYLSLHSVDHTTFGILLPVLGWQTHFDEDIRVIANQGQLYGKEVGKHVLWLHLKEPGIIKMKETMTNETKITAFK